MTARLHPDDLAAIIDGIADAVARRIESGTTSAPGIGVRGQGDPCDDEAKDRKPMDHIDTAADGESSSLQEAEVIGRRHMRRLIHGSRPSAAVPQRPTRRKESR